VDLPPLHQDPALVRLLLMNSPLALARAVATNAHARQNHRSNQASANPLADRLIRIPACRQQAGVDGVCLGFRSRFVQPVGGEVMDNLYRCCHSPRLDTARARALQP